MTSPVGAPYDPTGQPFPDLDGSGSLGPLRVQLSGEVLSHEITFKSNDGDKGVLAKLIDAAWWLKNNIGTAAQATALAFADVTITGAAKLKYTARSVSREMPMNGIIYSGAWSLASLQFLTWSSDSTSGVLHVPLYLPHGAVLDSVVLNYTGASGHAAFPAGKPGSMPSLAIRAVVPGVSSTLLGSTTDTTATAGAYESGHDISVTSIAHTVNAATTRYVALIAAESGANWITGSTLNGLTVTCTVTSQPEF